MAGAGYKLFNTGDVLTAAQVNTYLMEQTVMVFADAAARTAALSGVVSEGMISYLKDTNAVEVYNGSAWVASDDPNAIQNTIVDAKGDLITATGNDTPARIAVGNNGENLVADSSTSTGLRWQPAKTVNRVLNADFSIWQRGTSFTAGSVYTADRWYAGAIGARTISRQVTGDTTNLPNIQYCLRAQRTAASSSTTSIDTGQPFETANTIPLVGKTVTLSYYARRGADFSGASNALGIRIYTGTGTDQNAFAGYTGSATPLDTTVTLTTTWQRFSHTLTLATTVNELMPYFFYDPTGTAGTNDYFEITGIQLELGSVATAFQTATGTLAGELAACQRYYCKFGLSSNSLVGISTGASSTKARMNFQMPVQQRVSATSIDYSGLQLQDPGVNNFAVTSIAGLTGDALSQHIEITVASGLTQYRPYYLQQTASTSFVAFNAEL